MSENTASWQAPKAALCHCRVERKKGRIRRVPHDEAHCWFICRLDWSSPDYSVTERRERERKGTHIMTAT